MSPFSPSVEVVATGDRQRKSRSRTLAPANKNDTMRTHSTKGTKKTTCKTISKTAPTMRTKKATRAKALTYTMMTIRTTKGVLAPPVPRSGWRTWVRTTASHPMRRTRGSTPTCLHGTRGESRRLAKERISPNPRAMSYLALALERRDEEDNHDVLALRFTVKSEVHATVNETVER